MSLCDLGTGYGLEWCDLTSGCSYISTGSVLQVPSVPLKMNSYLLNKLWNIARSSSDICLLSDSTLLRSDSS